MPEIQYDWHLTGYGRARRPDDRSRRVSAPVALEIVGSTMDIGHGRALAAELHAHPAWVYDRCMAKVRTNIRLEDALVRTIMERYGVETKTEAVEIALRHLAGQPMSREEALAMRGAHAIAAVPADTLPPALP